MRYKSFIVAAVVLAIFAVLQVLRLDSVGVINVYWSQIVDLSLIITISATGLSLIYGFTGQFSLGHAAFYGIGAYVAGYITKTYGNGPNTSYFLFVVALIAGAVVAGAIAYLIGLPILRLRSDYLGIATLGFGVIMTVLLNNTDKYDWSKTMGGPRGMLGIPHMSSFAWIFFVAVAVILMARNFIFSSYGRACTSVREDEVAADIMGINTTRFKTLAFVLGCSLAGLAGGLYAHLYPFLHPSSFDWLKSLDVLLIVVLGGLGSLTGTVVTAIFWVFLQEILRAVLPPDYLDWRGVIYALVLIIVMIQRPSGLMGGKEFGFGKKSPAEPGKGAKSNASA